MKEQPYNSVVILHPPRACPCGKDPGWRLFTVNIAMKDGIAIGEQFVWECTECGERWSVGRLRRENLVADKTCVYGLTQPLRECGEPATVIEGGEPYCAVHAGGPEEVTENIPEPGQPLDWGALRLFGVVCEAGGFNAIVAAFIIRCEAEEFQTLEYPNASVVELCVTSFCSVSPTIHVRTASCPGRCPGRKQGEP